MISFIDAVGAGFKPAPAPFVVGGAFLPRVFGPTGMSGLLMGEIHEKEKPTEPCGDSAGLIKACDSESCLEGAIRYRVRRTLKTLIAYHYIQRFFTVRVHDVRNTGDFRALLG